MVQDKKNKIAVLGASDKEDRISNQLIRRLKAKGHEIFPVNPALKTIEGIAVYPTIEALPKGIDVLTIYLGPQRSDPLEQAMIDSGIPRMIFNPGAENPELEKRLAAQGITVEEHCSLVLLSVNQL